MFKNVVCYEIYCDVVPVLCLPVKRCINVTNDSPYIMLQGMGECDLCDKIQ